MKITNVKSSINSKSQKESQLTKISWLSFCDFQENVLVLLLQHGHNNYEFNQFMQLMVVHIFFQIIMNDINILLHFIWIKQHPMT